MKNYFNAVILVSDFWNSNFTTKFLNKNEYSS